jgi:hypothetical protein
MQNPRHHHTRHFRIKPVNANREAFARGRHLGSMPRAERFRGGNRLAFDTARRASIRIGRGRDRKPEGIGAETDARRVLFFFLFAEDDKTKHRPGILPKGEHGSCLNPRGLYNRPLQLRMANTTIMIIEFH